MNETDALSLSMTVTTVLSTLMRPTCISRQAVLVAQDTFALFPTASPSISLGCDRISDTQEFGRKLVHKLYRLAHRALLTRFHGQDGVVGG